MPSLRDAQLAFAGRVFGAGHSVSSREQIYRNNVFISLTGALADIYRVVQRLVGEKFFTQLARRYIRAYPSRSGNLHDFGRHLGGFMLPMKELKGLPYLADVAALEWACHESFHAAEAAALDFSRLTHPENAKAPLHPAARLVASRYPILAIWQANQAEEPGLVDLDAGADWLVVLRRELQVEILRSTPGEFVLLAGLRDGMALGDACEAALAAEPALDLPAAMGRFATHGLLTQGASQ
ncbi:MAG TPA: DNA-binding domain-containing protein [Burkholderiales bacterium]|jgi:hypothetical protein|nr:DNA-binding domain-containing protein [Burkholderiales bacterium]